VFRPNPAPPVVPSPPAMTKTTLRSLRSRGRTRLTAYTPAFPTISAMYENPLGHALKVTDGAARARRLVAFSPGGSPRFACVRALDRPRGGGYPAPGSPHPVPERGHHARKSLPRALDAGAVSISLAVIDDSGRLLEAAPSSMRAASPKAWTHSSRSCAPGESRASSEAQTPDRPWTTFPR
jgi:hypothetical protein